MSKMVTSRIPDEIYVQGSNHLSELGVGVSDLVRAAFDYLLATGKLPDVASERPRRMRTVSEQDRQDLRAKITASRLNIDLPDNWDYKSELADGKWSDYEALA